MKPTLLLLAAALVLCGCATTKPATPNPATVRETALKLPFTHVSNDGTVSSDLKLCNEPVPVVKP